mgnify:CR=1 FL=1
MNAAWPLILLPCLAGLACLAFRRRRAFCAVFSVASLGAEGALAALLFARGAAPWGWNGVPLLAADGLSRLVCLGIAFFGLMAGVYSLGWFSPRERGGAYWCLLLLTEAAGMGVSMHSNSHLGISLAAMAHVAAATPNLTYDCDTHYSWTPVDILEGGKFVFRNGRLAVPKGPGLGVGIDQAALARLHELYLTAGVTDRDDLDEVRKYEPGFQRQVPKW